MKLDLEAVVFDTVLLGVGIAIGAVFHGALEGILAGFTAPQVPQAPQAPVTPKMSPSTPDPQHLLFTQPHIIYA